MGLERKDHTGPEKQRDERKDHLVTKVLTEKEHAQHNSDGYNAQNRHRPFDQLQNLAELPDVA